MSSSKKSISFSSTPIGDKDVKALPGIGDAGAKKLRAAGYTKAQMVLDKYHVDCRRNEAEFLDWMIKEVKVGQSYAHDCVDALKEWCNQYKDEDEAKRLKIRIEKAKEAVKEAQADLAGLEEKLGKLAV